MKCLSERALPLFIASVTGYTVLYLTKKVAVPKQITRSIGLIGTVPILNNY